MKGMIKIHKTLKTDGLKAVTGSWNLQDVKYKCQPLACENGSNLRKLGPMCAFAWPQYSVLHIKEIYSNYLFLCTSRTFDNHATSFKFPSYKNMSLH
jgi:hypothetical protein